MLDDLRYLRSRLPDEPADQPRAIRFHDLPGAEHTERTVDFREKPGYGRLPLYSGVARKDHVQRLFATLESFRRPKLLHPDIVGEFLHLAFYARQADLGHQRPGPGNGQDGEQCRHRDRMRMAESRSHPHPSRRPSANRRRRSRATATAGAGMR